MSFQSPITNHNVLVGAANLAIGSIAPGTSGNILTSNGTDWTSAAPAAAGASYALTWNAGAIISPADATTYYMIQVGTWQTTAQLASRFYIPKTGTVRQVFGIITASAGGTSENVTVAVRLNDTTNTNITTTLQMTGTANTFSNAAMSMAVTQGDYIQIQVITPTWVTNPINCSFMASVFIS